MRIKALLPLLLLVSLPGFGWSQSTLNFPKLFSAAELSNGAGFALVNPTSTSSVVTYALYGATGAIVARANQTIPAGGQSAKLGSELFPGVTTGGWVQVTTSTTGIQGFWLGGDFVSNEDGGAAAGPATSQLFPLIGGQTELNLADLSSSSNTLTLRLLGADGTDVASPSTLTIPPNGVIQSTISSTAQLDINLVRTALVSGTAPFAATSVVHSFLVNKETAVLNATDMKTALNTLNFPHAVSGTLGISNYTTIVGVTNLGASPQNVTLTFHPDPNGTPIVISKTILPLGSIRDTAQNIFGFPATFQAGWIQVAASSPVTGFVAYAETGSGGLAAVPIQAAPQSSMLFAHIAGLPVWFTGLALLNATTTDANVEIYAMTPDGALIGGPPGVAAAAFTLGAGRKKSNLLSELIPAAALQNGGWVFIRTTNNVPLYGIELFGSNNGPILANVPPGTLVPGINFVPPAGSQPLTISSVSPRSVTRGAPLTVTGTGFDTTATNDTVIFETATGTVAATATSPATATSVTVTVPSDAISGPVQVQTGGQTTTANNTVIEVFATATSLVQSTITIAAGQLIANTDIYVPSSGPAALNATLVGVADVGVSQIFFSTASVEVVRGTTRQLAVAGTGIGSGSLVSISGSGISFSGQPIFSNLSDGTPFVLVTLTIAANAVQGPRNIIVTNADLQTSMLTGGIFIR